jgi:hypothetical protein
LSHLQDKSFADFECERYNQRTIREFGVNNVGWGVPLDCDSLESLEEILNYLKIVEKEWRNSSLMIYYQDERKNLLFLVIIIHKILLMNCGIYLKLIKHCVIKRMIQQQSIVRKIS